jgi:hypothetical protein
MKQKKEYIVLVIVIVALALYLVLRKSDSTHYQMPQLAELTPKQISRIEVKAKDKSLELYKKDDRWYVGSKPYLADNKKVGEMLDVLVALKVTALVSESANYIRYDLSDDKKITLKAWAGDQLKRELEIGKVANTFQHTFIKLPKDRSVYHGRGNFRRNFDVNLDQLQDKTVFFFDKSKITEVVIQSGGKSLIATKSEISKGASDQPAGNQGDAIKRENPHEDKKTVWQAADGKKVDESELNSLFSILSGLSCERYIENRKKEDFKDPIFKVRLKGIKAHTLSIFDKRDKKANEYPAVSSENSDPFILSNWTADKILKYPAKILEKVDKP